MPRYQNPADINFFQGEPTPNGKLFFFESGTSTPKATYADVVESIQNSQPVLLDSAGREPNIFYSGSAKVVLQDENGQQVWERDPVGGELTSGAFSDYTDLIIYQTNALVKGSDGNFYRSIDDANQGNDPTLTSAFWVRVQFLEDWNSAAEYEIDDIVIDDKTFWKSLTTNTNILPSTDGGTNWIVAIGEATLVSNTPTNISPTDSATDEALEPTLTGSAYSGTDTQIHRQYQVATDSLFTLIVVDILGSGDDLTSITLTDKLDETTEYFWRIRDIGVNSISEFSAETSFTTKAVSILMISMTSSPSLLGFTVDGDVLTQDVTVTTEPTSPASGQLDWDGTGIFLALTRAETTSLEVYKRDGLTLNKLTSPSKGTLTKAKGIAFTSDGIYLAAVGESSGSERIRWWKRTGDTFANLPISTGLLATSKDTCQWDGTDTYLATSSDNAADHVAIYKRTGDTIAKIVPASLPPQPPQGLSWSGDSVYLAGAHVSTPFISIYKRSGDTFTKLPNPATLPSGNGFCCAFSNDGVYLAVGHSTGSARLTIYKRSGDVFTKLTVDVPDIAETPTSLAWSKDGAHLYRNGNAPYLFTIKRVGDVFTEIANPATAPTSGIVSNGIAVRPRAWDI